MSKTFGAACLVAGTTIGAGMLALPLTVASLGIIWGSVCMFVMWYVMYAGALFTAELSLRLGKGSTLGFLGRHFGGKSVQVIALFNIMLLAYALLSAYLFGGASITSSFLESVTGNTPSFNLVIIGIAAFLSVVLYFCTKWVDRSNRILFLLLIAFFIVLIIGLSVHFDEAVLSFIPSTIVQLKSWRIVIPVLFTSFGFHLMIGSMVEYCDQDQQALRKVFFWGSLIPAFIYFIWFTSTLSFIYVKAPNLYETLLLHQGDLGKMMQQLGRYTLWIQQCSWIVAFLSILTSALGIGLSLLDTWKEYLPKGKINSLIALFLTFSFPFCVAIFVPQAFIKALSFSGMILAIIAVLLPTCLVIKNNKVEKNKTFYQESRNQFLQIFLIMIALIVIVCELMNMVLN